MERIFAALQRLRWLGAAWKQVWEIPRPRSTWPPRFVPCLESMEDLILLSGFGVKQPDLGVAVTVRQHVEQSKSEAALLRNAVNQQAGADAERAALDASSST